MSDKIKKKQQKLIWVPRLRLEWAQQYYNENEKELNKLGIYSFEDLIWRLTDLGKEDLEALVQHLRSQYKAKAH